MDNRWDDFNYKTSFEARVYSPDGDRYSLGTVKIGKKGLGQLSQISDHPLPNEFNELDLSFFSVGQDETYYTTLKLLGDELRQAYLEAMRDVAFSSSLLSDIDSEPVFQKSLLRGVHKYLLKSQFSRLARGLNRFESFGFAYERNIDSDISMQFDVKPESMPPTNVHVLIGSNGVGKTTLLKRLADVVRYPSLMDSSLETFKINHSQDGMDSFWTLVAVAFSAFDSFGEQPVDSDATSPSDVTYFYLGLKKPRDLKHNDTKDEDDNSLRYFHKSTDDLVSEFRVLLKSIVKSSKGKFERFARAIKILASDPLIATSRFRQQFDEEDFMPSPDIEHLVNDFKAMSSGHKIVLLSIAGLVNHVDEKTLVLIDEPETHLHPPLLSAYIRAVSSLLIERNGVAIVATHSPVVLQEVPKSCVWKLSRHGDALRVDRPEIETFGENVGTLTREAFGLEVTESGFFKIIKDLVAKHESYDEVMDALGLQLGIEGRAMARILVAENKPQ